jgi:hypothetical protein
MFQLQLFFLLHCDEWDRVVALPRHKFVTGATILQLEKTEGEIKNRHPRNTGNIGTYDTGRRQTKQITQHIKQKR